PRDELRECPSVRRDDCRKSEKATSIQNCRNPKRRHGAREKVPARDSPNRRSPISAGADPNSEGCRMTRRRPARQQNETGGPKKKKRPPSHKGEMGPRGVFRIRDKIWRLSAAARRSAIAVPNCARQQQADPTVHWATRHPD